MIPKMSFALCLSIAPLLTQAWVSSPASCRTSTGSTSTPFQRNSGNGGIRLFAANNVVLEPSMDEKRFDNLKVGNARVHRYSREEDPDSETNYVMWYHGRSKDLQEGNDKLVPLSTGRIGRATSKNGLIWVKDEVGSASEDVEDVSLGLNKESWWGFDTAHVGLGNVLLPMTTPAVMTEGGVYLMYYMGGNFEDSLAADFMDKEIPENMKDTKIQGMKMRIGVAVSQDGMSWGRVEGDDPTGACMAPYESDDPNAQVENLPKNMEDELYCAWPEVAVNIEGGKEEAFLMYYSTMTKDSKEKCLALAVSDDGFRWYKKGLCLKPDADTLDDGGCARCCVYKDATFDEDTNTWTEPGTWKMYYEGVSKSDNKHRIMEAESPDGKKWTKTGIALDIGESGSWDCEGVGAPHVVRMDDGTSRMYYTGQGEGGTTAIGVVKKSQDGGQQSWIREQASFSLA